MRDIQQSDVVCWAGSAVGGCGVFCGIERHHIDVAHEPETLRLWCTGDYQSCPTWRTARDAEIAGRWRQFDREIAAS